MLPNTSVQTISPKSSACVDIVGDVHGCANELFHLLKHAGWKIVETEDSDALIHAHHPEGRKLLFAGDLVNKGPDTPRVLRLFLGMLQDGLAHAVMGNHEAMLLDALHDPSSMYRKKTSSTLSQLAALRPRTIKRIATTLATLPHQLRVRMPEGHSAYGDGHLTLVHAACPEPNIDRRHMASRQRSIFGYSKPEQRINGHWGHLYRGKRCIIHGHTPSKAVRQRGNVFGIDTGIVGGGSLTLLRLDDLTGISTTPQLEVTERQFWL